MLKSKNMYGRLTDLPFAIGFLALAGIAISSFYNYEREECQQSGKCVVQKVKETKK